MNKEILFYPKNATLYQGVDNEKYTSKWYTNHVGYASAYALKNKNAVIKVYSTESYLKLLNIENIKLNRLSNKKDIIIKSKNNKSVLEISLRDLFKIIFGKGCKKLPQVKNEEDINELQKENSKFKGTQYYLLYKLLNILNPTNQFLKHLKYVMNNKNRIKVITKTNDFNRISRIQTDKLFLTELKKKLPILDGYYAPDIKSDFNNFKDYGNYYQKSELGLFENNLKLLKIIKNPNHIYKMFKNDKTINKKLYYKKKYKK